MKKNTETNPRSGMIFPEELFDFDTTSCGESFEHQGLFEGIGYVWEALARLASYIETYLEKSLHQHNANIMPGAIVGPHVVLGADVTVEPHVYIKGPALIGDRTEIRHGTYIRENVIIGRDCVIGKSAEIKHAIVMDGAKASHWNYVGDSILGFDVNLGAGVKLSNKKITNDEIRIRDIDGTVYQTGLQKLGAIIGDGTQIGCNAVLNPGILLGKRCLVYPLTSVRQTYFHNEVIKR